MMSSLKLNNGVEIDLVSRGETFLGLGGVRVGTTSLRSSRRPMFVEIRNPSGITLSDWRVTASDAKADGAVLTLAGKRSAGGIMEYMVHEVRNRVNTTDWTDEPTAATDTSLKLHIKPINRKIGGNQFVGFSYRYEYASKSIPIYRINDRSTWEIGGKAVGNTFWMRSCFNPAIASFTGIEQHYSTEWYLPDCANPNVFQFLPLQTELQGFSFTSSEAGVLVTWTPSVSHVRSLFEKQRGKDEIVHLHEHCGDLADQFSSPVVEVLYLAGKFDRTGLFNVYDDVRELVHDTLHGELGMRRERVTTYGQIEEWTMPDLKRYTDLGLPKLLEAGCKTVYVANHFRNNMNTWDVGNMCCTVDYHVAEKVGENNLKRFCDVAKAGGATVEMWGNTSISVLTWAFGWENKRSENGPDRIKFLPVEGSIGEAIKGKPHAFVRNASNAIEADHYTPIFCVLNLREPAVHDYWMKRWTYASEKVGLGGIFLDSSFNLSSDKFHWVQNTQTDVTGATADQTQLLGFHRPAQEPPAAILSQFRAHLDLFTEMQKAGYVYCNEDLGVFGVHRHGPGVEKRLDSLPMWADCYCNFDKKILLEKGVDADAIFFQGLAHRMMWAMHWDIKNDALCWNYYGTRDETDLPSLWQIALLKAYSEVEPNLKKRSILAGDKGVLWTGGAKLVLWAFSDFEHPLGATTPVRDVMQNERVNVSALQAKKNHLYVFG